MPSPFPGMDPYLEHPALWPGVHQGIIAAARAMLNTILPPQYVADIGERLYVVQPERSIYPDVVVVEHPAFGRSAPSQGTSTPAALVSDPPWILTLPVAEIREVFIEIVAIADASLVVTAIEVLSPSNKLANSPGRQLYVDKQRQLLQSQTHLIEIDVLRSGEHTYRHKPVPLLSHNEVTWADTLLRQRGLRK